MKNNLQYNFLILKYDKTSYNNIITILEKMNIKQHNIGNWDIFDYIVYDVKNNYITNMGAQLINKLTFVDLCYCSNEFIFKICKYL